MYKILIIYYSMNGNTDYAAHRIAEKTGADLLRIEPVKAYPDKGIRKYLWGGKSALMSEKPPLQPYSFSADDYDRIVLAFPVWAGTVAPPLRTFVSENLFTLQSKVLFAYACQAGSGGEQAIKKLRRMLYLRAFRATMVLNDPKDNPSDETESKLQDFCDALLAAPQRNTSEYD